MQKLKQLFINNRQWADRVTTGDPDFFRKLAKQQRPEYLWIGCADSRVPANEICGLAPGEMFVHRNIANVVVHTDLNCLSVIQFAIDVLKIKHIIVCGHYGCSGIRTALLRQRIGVADNWLQHIHDVRERHGEKLTGLSDESAANLLGELNVIEQVLNVCRTTIVQDAWARGQELSMHGWVYDLQDGLLRDLGMTISSPEEVYPTYNTALAGLS